MARITKYIIEGLDRLGKSTLIDGIRQSAGYFEVIHYDKPQRLDFYEGDLRKYQEDCFDSMFSIMNSHARVIFDRAHLGECVYSPLYRGYSGDYVFDLERQNYIDILTDVRLILLTENFDISQHFVDDGLSFDPKARCEEQELFLKAFHKSNIKDKRIVCVTHEMTGKFKDKQRILKECIED